MPKVSKEGLRPGIPTIVEQLYIVKMSNFSVVFNALRNIAHSSILPDLYLSFCVICWATKYVALPEGSKNFF